MKKNFSSEEAMKQWGETIGSLLRGGEFIELVGDIGAGKTTLTKGLAKGMGVTDVIQSPTFSINRVYDGREHLRLAHYDFYRLADPGIMADELEETAADENTVIVVEWGDIVSEVKPADHLTIAIISPSEHTREANVEAHGKHSLQLMDKMR